MKKTTLLALAAGALALPAAGTAASPGHRCSAVGSATGNIRAYHVTCRTAHRVVRADIQGKRYRNFGCKSTRHPGGATVRCRSGSVKKVTYQIAD